MSKRNYWGDPLFLEKTTFRNCTRCGALVRAGSIVKTNEQTMHETWHEKLDLLMQPLPDRA